MQLYGSLKNLARRMLEAFRYMILNDQAFAPPSRRQRSNPPR